jgi:polyphenol oxidase
VIELGSAGHAATITLDWPAPPRVRAAFTLRSGGVSLSPYDSLNVGAHVGDAVDAVRENRRRVRNTLQLPAEPVWLQQVHGTDVVDLDVLGTSIAEREAKTVQTGAPGLPQRGGAMKSAAEATPSGALRVADAIGPGSEHPHDGGAVPFVSGTPRGDAAVARVAGRVCVIQVADCMPVLFAARDGSAVGAAHAGWRGLAGGVIEQTVRKLGVPPAALLAWLGPTISQQHFEVGDDVRTAFVSGDAGAASAFVANMRGRWQCDLYALARRRLAGLGVNNVFGGGWCTYGEAARFFSFRRNGQCGRMAALIWLQ